MEVQLLVKHVLKHYSPKEIIILVAASDICLLPTGTGTVAMPA
jgi:hypothetical protein